jgi:lysophosphatidate acyltransferase
MVHGALDLEVKIEEEEYLQAKPAVYMSNHQSMIDILILGRWASRNANHERSLGYYPKMLS